MTCKRIVYEREVKTDYSTFPPRQTSHAVRYRDVHDEGCDENCTPIEAPWPAGEPWPGTWETSEMSSTLCIRKTPKPSKQHEWHFKQPIKGLIARRFYDHDGSLGGGLRTIGPEHLPWFEGILSAGNFDAKDVRDLERIVAILAEGDSIDVWFEC